MASQPRGLQNFISDIRNCQSKEDERARVDKELANIRQKFAASSSLSSYQKKKYVWKLCYIYMLGYDIDFGHIELISLLSSTKFQEKSVGYMGVALLLKPGDDMMSMVVNSIKNDLLGSSNFGTTLALAAVGNFGGMDFSEALGGDVQRMLIRPADINRGGPAQSYEEEVRNKSLIRKKAALCLLTLYRSNKDVISVDDWVDHMAMLLTDSDLGVLISTMSLLLGVCVNNAAEFEGMVPYVVDILHKIAVQKNCTHDYLYYQTTSPWLHVKCLRFLQNYAIPADTDVREKLNEVLRRILQKMETADNNSTKNGDYSILFEAVNLIITYREDAESRLHTSALAFLGRFIGLDDANIRYLGLDAMYKLVKVEGASEVQQHLDVVISSIKESDISIRKRALDLLFVITSFSNAERIVDELLLNLSSADVDIKDEIIVKIAILSEKFAKDLTWYLDTLVKVIMIAGDFVSEDVWHRVVHIVTNHPELHDYAAEKLCEIVQSKFAHETAVALGGYILGEFGTNVCERPGMSGYEQFAALHAHFPAVSLKVKAILLTTYVKMFNCYPDVRESISEIFRKYSVSGHLELQQRACEYLQIPTTGADTMESILNTMPAYPDNRESSLLKRLESKKGPDAPLPAQRPKPQMNSSGGGDVTAAVAPSKEIDLLSLDDFASEPVASSTPLGIPADVEPKLRGWFNAVTFGAGKTTTLYEDSFIRLGISFEYRAHQGRLVIYVNNNHNDDISNVKFSFSKFDGLTITTTQEVASKINFGEQSKTLLAVECLKPFSDAPEFTISFSTKTASFSYPLRLPVLASCFFEPVVLEKAAYMQNWKGLEGGDREVQEVFQCGKKITPHLMASIRNNLGPALKLGPATGLDSETTYTACATFRTGTPSPDGNGFVSVGGMMRMEADPAQGRIRITARAKHGGVALAMKNALKAHLV